MNDAWWLQQIFGRSLADKANPEDARLFNELPPQAALQLMTRIFHNCGEWLRPFNDRQVAEGVAFLGSSGESDWMFHLYDPAIDQATRFACIRSFEVLYSDCFARRCREMLVHYSDDVDPLNGVCYMWWDVFPMGSPVINETEQAAVDHELIEVMGRTLQIEHTACQESSLHGLGHWQPADPSRIRVIIDNWLANHPRISTDLRAYAAAARAGHVQ